MSIINQIMAIYPSLTEADFNPRTGTIFIQNDSDGNGDYIKSWTNNNPQPTIEQLVATGIL
jgi:hypothetical protein